MSTPFYLQTQLWTDDPSDFPLSYRFEYVVVDGDAPLTLRPRSTTTNTVTTLGEGQSHRRYEITVRVVVSDNFDCESDASTPVKVEPIANTLLLQNAMSTQMTAALRNSNPDKLLSVVGSISNSLNRVDCSGANDAFCSNLNRQVCGKVLNTCGNCLPSFVGVFGESNSPCMKSDSVRARRLQQHGVSAVVRARAQQQHKFDQRKDSNSPDYVSSFYQQNSTIDAHAPIHLTGSGFGSCGADSECFSRRCNKNFRCSPAMKTCDNECSGNGLCAYFDSAGKQVPECFVQDAFCHAHCLCNAAFRGRSCSLDMKTFSDQKVMRETMCYNLYKILKIQDVDQNVVTQRANTIFSLMRDPNQVSEAALANCSAVLFRTVIDYPTYAASGDTASVIINTLSALLGVNSALRGPSSATSETDSVSSGVVSALAALALGRQSYLAVGELEASLGSEYIRLKTWKSSREDLPVNSFPGLSLPLDTQFQSQVPKVEFTANMSRTDPGRSALVYGITMLQFTKNIPTLPQSNATNLRLLTYLYGAANDSASFGSPVNTVVSLVNKRPINYHSIFGKNETVQNLQLHCDWTKMKAPYTLNTTCGDGNKYFFNCDGITRGYFNFTCPDFERKPICKADFSSLNAGFTQISSGLVRHSVHCRTLSYNELNTTCLCPERPNAFAATGSITASYSISVNLSWGKSSNHFIPNEKSPRPTYSSLPVLSSSVLFTFFLLVFFSYFSLDYMQAKSSRSEKMSKTFPRMGKLQGKNFGELQEKPRDENMIPQVQNWEPHDENGTAVYKATSHELGNSNDPLDVVFNRALPPTLNTAYSPWQRFLHTILKRHSLLSIIPCLSGDSYSLASLGVSNPHLHAWTCTHNLLVFASRVVTLLTVSSAVALYAYPDDGTCGDQQIQELCGSLRIPVINSRYCNWDSHAKYCVYAASSIGTADVLIMSFLFVMASEVICQYLYLGIQAFISILRYNSACIERNRLEAMEQSRLLAASLGLDDEPPAISNTNEIDIERPPLDALCSNKTASSSKHSHPESQTQLCDNILAPSGLLSHSTRRSMLMLGARLSKIQEHVDMASAEEEIMHLKSSSTSADWPEVPDDSGGMYYSCGVGGVWMDTSGINCCGDPRVISKLMRVDELRRTKWTRKLVFKHLQASREASYKVSHQSFFVVFILKLLYLFLSFLIYFYLFLSIFVPICDRL